MVEENGEDVLDCDGIASFWSEVVEEFCYALLAGGVVAERINDPDLAEVNCCCESGGFWVSWDELHILNSTSL